MVSSWHICSGGSAMHGRDGFKKKRNGFKKRRDGFKKRRDGFKKRRKHHMYMPDQL